MKNRHHTILLCLLFVVAAGCLEDPATTEIGTSAAALNPVTWTELVGVSASGNDLTKTAPETTFNAGAVSVESLSGDGHVEFTSAENTTDKACGLASGNGDQKLADIDYAIRLNASGNVSIVEGGTTRAAAGSYVAGDVFRVQVLGGVVTYHRNGELLYTSALAPSSPLVVDTALRTPGATINDVAIESLVFWQNEVRTSAVGNDLTRSATTSSWNGGASSIASIPSGDGYVEFRAGDSVSDKAAGLSNGDGGPTRDDIDYAVVLSDGGTVSVVEGGVSRGGFGTYRANDVFAVQVVDGVVSYFHNNVFMYTSQVAPTYPLVLDASIRTTGASILDGRVVAGQGVPDCAPYRQSFYGSQSFGFYGEDIEGSRDLLVEDGPGVNAYIFREGDTGWFVDEQVGSGVKVDEEGITMIRGYQLDSSVQVYRRADGVWVDDGVLTLCGDDEINEMSLSADRVVLGSFGKAYVFRRGGSGWTLQGILLPEGVVGSIGFGGPVATAGSRVFVGAYEDNTAATQAGAVYVFRLDSSLPAPPPVTCQAQGPGKWVEETVLVASNAAAYQHFAWFSLDTNRNGTALIAGNINARTASVFSRSGGQWSETALLAPHPLARWFGIEVAFGGPGPDGDSVAIVGSRINDDKGRAYLFAHPGGVWRQIDYFTAPVEYYGYSVAASANAVFVGDRINSTGAPYAGAFHVHDIDPSCLAE